MFASIVTTAVVAAVAVVVVTILPAPAVVAAAVVIVVIIIPNVSPSIVVVFFIMVAHVCSLLLVQELIGLEGLQRHLLVSDHIVALLDGCLGDLMVHVHLVCPLSL